MTPLALSQYGMHTKIFSPLVAPFTLMHLASTISKFSVPLIALYAQSNIPIAEAKGQPTITSGKDEDSFVQCMNACDKIEEETIRLLCYAGCALVDLFKKKEK